MVTFTPLAQIVSQKRGFQPLPLSHLLRPPHRTLCFNLHYKNTPIVLIYTRIGSQLSSVACQRVFDNTATRQVFCIFTFESLVEQCKCNATRGFSLILKGIKSLYSFRIIFIYVNVSVFVYKLLKPLYNELSFQITCILPHFSMSDVILKQVSIFIFFKVFSNYKQLTTKPTFPVKCFTNKSLQVWFFSRYFDNVLPAYNLTMNKITRSLNTVRYQ